MGFKTKKCTIKINFKRTNKIQDDDDVHHKGKYFRGERKKKISNRIFDLSACRFTQI
jgi:hypothetical protein